MKKKRTKNYGSLIPSKEELIILLDHFQNARFLEAENLAVSITKKFPNHQFAWKVLGALFGQTGRNTEALDVNKKSVLLSPQDPEAHNNLGVSYKELSRLNEAKVSFKKALNLKSDYIEAYTNLGITYKELGRLEQSEASHIKAIELKPKYAEAHSNLGNTYAAQNKFEKAVASYMKAIALKSNYPEAHNNLGIIFAEFGIFEKAEESFKQAISLKSSYAEAYSNLGNALRSQGRLQEAEKKQIKAIAINPKNAGSYNNLGNLLKDLGRLDEAEKSYIQAITLKPEYAEAHRHLTVIKKFTKKDEQYSKMLDLYNNENNSEEQLCHINFGLAKAYEDLGDFEKAYTHYDEGNTLRKKILNYDINQDLKDFKKLKDSYHQIKNNYLDSNKLSKNLIPIFIVGMPRSGTTLVEQILSSHSNITGAGELLFASKFGEAIAKGLSKINDISLLEFRENYLEKLKHLSKGNFFVTDKMPQNFRLIGLLAAAFPEAKIIHTKRDPAAVCWSNYKQYFSSRNLGFPYAIKDIVSYYKLYKNLMEFWENTLGHRIYNLDYELLVNDQEKETRKLIQNINIDWDDKCLSPQDNPRGVGTASNIQVRKKIYKGSSQQWKKYENFLHGVFDNF